MNDPLHDETQIEPLNRRDGGFSVKRGAVLLLLGGLFVAASAYAMMSRQDQNAVIEQPEPTPMRVSTLPPVTFMLPPEPEIVAAAEPVAVTTAPEPTTRIVYREKPRPVIDQGMSGSSIEIKYTEGQVQGTGQIGTQSQAAFFGGGSPDVSTQVASNSAHGVQTVVAGQLDNLSVIVPRGAVVPCVLGSRLVSQIGGQTSCRVTHPVLSADGSRTLIDQGSVITGEYKSAVAQGMNRIAIIWDRLRTPSGVVVNIQSAAADQIGTIGVQGSVDRHFWERVGGSLLVSLIDSAVVASARPDTNANVVVGNASQASSEIALEILRASISIPPTVSIHQGARVNAVLSSDLDFTGVL